MDSSIRVLYSCEGCGLRDVGVEVSARVPGTDIGVWIDQTRAAVTIDHRRRSSFCQAPAMQELRIPVAGVNFIGGSPVQ